MDNFLSIYQFIIENNPDFRHKDIFKMAIQAYEDEYGEVSDQIANKFYEETA